jgi:hypothetical protein
LRKRVPESSVLRKKLSLGSIQAAAVVTVAVYSGRAILGEKAWVDPFVKIR